jgi:hypothetical protein
LTPSYRKPQVSPPEKLTVQPVDAFEDIAFKPKFEFISFQTSLWSVSSSLFFFCFEIDTTNGFLTLSLGQD